ncbi:MAG: Uma2 family endonuclease [Cyanobacteria bacterium J06581_3]
MVDILTAVATNVWVTATWEEFTTIKDDPKYDESIATKFYFDDGQMRIEDMGIGSAHGQDNSILASAISLYGTLKDLNYVTFTGSSFQKIGERECQPDLAYYIDKDIQRPVKNNQPVSVDTYGPPTLAIEISASTLGDDLGKKRLLYERLNVQEYWVVDVEASEVIAFKVDNGGSHQIQTSMVLPNLNMSIIEEALERSKTEDDGAINRWLLKHFS